MLLKCYQAVNQYLRRVHRTVMQPPLPSTNAIQTTSVSATEEPWFDYPVYVYPHHTDYAGIVWHGTYVSWLEAARIEYLRSLGVEFSDLVALGCDLPVVEMSLRYHRALRMGLMAIVQTRMTELTGVRMLWDYKIQSPDAKELFITAQVTLVTVDREKGKIMRQLPPAVKDVFARLKK